MRTHLKPGIQPTKPVGTMPSLSALQSDQGSASNIECSHREQLPASTNSSAASIPQYLPPATYSEQDILISLSDFVAQIERSPKAKALSSSNISALKLIEYEKSKYARFNVFDNTQEIPTEILAPKLEEFMAWFRLSNEISSQASSIEKKMANREFTLFPKLPIELRGIVWGEALPGRRVVEIFSDLENTFFELQKTGVHASKAAHETLFAMRATCKQAYNIVSKKYRPIAAHNLGLRELPRKSLILINDEIDILYLSFYASWICLKNTIGGEGLARLTELAKLTKLALPVSRIDSVKFITSWLPELRSLKKLIWVDGTDDDRYCGSRLHFSETSSANEGYPWTNTL